MNYSPGMEFAWRHKNVLLTGSGVYALLKDYPNGFTTTEFDADGKPIRSQTEHNFIQHIANQTVRGMDHLVEQGIEKTVSSHPWLPLAVIAVIFLWLRPILTRVWHLPRKRHPTGANKKHVQYRNQV